MIRQNCKNNLKSRQIAQEEITSELVGNMKRKKNHGTKSFDKFRVITLTSQWIFTLNRNIPCMKTKQQQNTELCIEKKANFAKLLHYKEKQEITNI